MRLKETLKWLLAVTVIAAPLTSCNNEEDEMPAAKAIAGTYSGWSKFVFTYSPSGMNHDAQTVTLSAEGDNTVTVSYSSDDLGSCAIAGVGVVKGEGGYNLSTTAGKYSMGAHGGEAKEYDCEVSGTISSDKTTYSIVFSLPSVMGGSTIMFQNGTAPVADK